MVDSTNTLISEKGYYETHTNMASFKTNVLGKNPDYTLETDTMQYNVETNIIYFRDKTRLTDTEGSVFNHESGEYNTSEKRSTFTKGILETESYELTGDKLYLDDIRRYYKANDNVFLVSKENDVIISGDIGEYWRDKQLTKIYGNALMRQIDGADTLFLKADTLVSIDSDIDSLKRLLAYKNVKIFKNNLQGKSDSLSYFLADSTIFFYQDPVLWTEGNQLTADSINVIVMDGGIDRLNMAVNSFVISQDTVLNFNQIKGRHMTAYFKENEIASIHVNGNGESIYFALEDEDNAVIGMNRILCSDMTIKFDSSQVKNIIFYKKPEGKLIPPHELQEPDKRLQGFVWRKEDRPGRNEMTLYQVKRENDAVEKIKDKIEENEDKRELIKPVKSIKRKPEIPNRERMKIDGNE